MNQFTLSLLVAASLASPAPLAAQDVFAKLRENTATMERLSGASAARAGQCQCWGLFPCLCGDGCKCQPLAQAAKRSPGCGCCVGERCTCGPECNCVCAVEKKKTGVIGYYAAMELAALTNRPCVVFVGYIESRAVPGAITCRSGYLYGYPHACIVVCEPDGKGWMQEKKTLSPGATDADIQAAINGPARTFGVRQPTQDFHYSAPVVSSGGRGGNC